MKQRQVTDWNWLLTDLLRAGLNWQQIGNRLGVQFSDRMIKYYAAGAQPLHFRGEAMIRLWSEVSGKDRAALPTVELIRGHRVARKPIDHAPQLQALPNWPPVPPAAVAPSKRKGGRPRKVVAA